METDQVAACSPQPLPAPLSQDSAITFPRTVTHDERFLIRVQEDGSRLSATPRDISSGNPSGGSSPVRLRRRGLNPHQQPSGSRGKREGGHRFFVEQQFARRKIPDKPRTSPESLSTGMSVTCSERVRIAVRDLPPAPWPPLRREPDVHSGRERVRLTPPRADRTGSDRGTERGVERHSPLQLCPCIDPGSHGERSLCP